MSEDDRKALRVLGLEVDADRRALRQRYLDLVRRYHPDKNGGDRSHEKALQAVIAAYTALKGRPAFAGSTLRQPQPPQPPQPPPPPTAAALPPSLLPPPPSLPARRNVWKSAQPEPARTVVPNRATARPISGLVGAFLSRSD